MVSLPDGLRPEISRGSQIFWMLWSVSSIETEIIVVYNAVTKKTVRTRLRLKSRQWSPRRRRSSHQRLLASSSSSVYLPSEKHKTKTKTETVITKTETQQPPATKTKTETATTCHTDLNIAVDILLLCITVCTGCLSVTDRQTSCDGIVLAMHSIAR